MLDLAKMVLAVQKRLKMTRIIIIDNSYSYNISKNSISGEVLDLGLHLDVFGAGLGQHGPGCPETPWNDKNHHLEQL